MFFLVQQTFCARSNDPPHITFVSENSAEFCDEMPLLRDETLANAKMAGNRMIAPDCNYQNSDFLYCRCRERSSLWQPKAAEADRQEMTLDPF